MESNRALISFINAALFDALPEQGCLDTDYDALYSTAKRNAIEAIVYNGIQKLSARLTDRQRELFEAAQDKALYAYAMQSLQLAETCRLLEQAEIPFVVLKGSVIRDLYPSPELRTSCDIDILVRAEDEKLKRVMENAGLQYSGDDGTTINFIKGPVEIELHRRLFDDEISFSDYFGAVWERVLPTEGWKYQYVMTQEDFFAYMLAHFAKHFSRYGCGIRNALDLGVYLKNAPADFDSEKADAVLQKIGLYEFKNKLVQLLEVWRNHLWQPADEHLTDYILGCGQFGNVKTRTTHTILIKRNTTSKFFLNHIFPNWKVMTGLYPILKKLPFLLPFYWAARWIRLLVKDKKHVRATLETHKQAVSGNTISDAEQILREVHLNSLS